MSENTSRVIKRYANRKLYDTQDSKYVTLEQISVMIREGEDVTVVDNNTKDDLTSVTLAQIIFEEEKKQRSFLPLAALRNIIQSGGESIQDIMTQISESADRVGRIFTIKGNTPTSGAADEAAPGAAPDQAEATPSPGATDDPTGIFGELRDTVQRALEEWQHRLDANFHQALDTVSPLSPLQREISKLRERIADLEQKLSQFEATEPDSAVGPSSPSEQANKLPD